MVCCWLSTSFPRDSSIPQSTRVFRDPIRMLPFLRSSHSAVHRSAKTKVMASDWRTMSISEISLLQTEIRDSNPHRILDNHDFSVADQRSSHQDVHVVTRGPRHANHAVRPQLQNLSDGHDPSTQLHGHLDGNVGEVR